MAEERAERQEHGSKRQSTLDALSG
jgi:hypothetical protein